MTQTSFSSSFSTSIDDVVNYAARFRKRYGYIVIVLDHINEQQNLIGQLASSLYSLIKKNIRATDTIIRFSQDCWLICLDNCDEYLLHWTSSALQSTLHRRKMLSVELNGALTYVNMGFFEKNIPHHAMKTVEKSIEASKTVLRHHKTMRTTALAPLEAESAHQINYIPLVIDAVFENRVCLAFQPIVQTRSGKVHHYESLVRIIDKDGQVLPAVRFIPQCEKSGHVQLIDQRIQQLAIEEMLRDRDLCLAINVSSITACDPYWLNSLNAQMRTHPNLRGRLLVELTETSVFKNIDESVNFLAKLREMGCLICIDDFGSGYMSLMHIKSDLVQYVKIDAQFVKNMKEDPKSIHFIRTIKALTEPYKIKCIAEGVEDEETALLLENEKIDYLQGYHIDKPTPIRKWM